MGRNGTVKCTFAEDINSCQYFVRKTKECTNKAVCSYQDERIKSEYVRKERWYEKYYKDEKK